MNDLLPILTPAALVTVPSVLLAWVFRRVITGDLVPRARMEEALAQRDKWQGVAVDLLNQNTELSQVGKVTRDVLRALPEIVADKEGTSGDAPP